MLFFAYPMVNKSVTTCREMTPPRKLLAETIHRPNLLRRRRQRVVHLIQVTERRCISPCVIPLELEPDSKLSFVAKRALISNL